MRFRLVPVVIVACLVAVACGTDGVGLAEEPPPTSPTSSTTTATSTSTTTSTPTSTTSTTTTSTTATSTTATSTTTGTPPSPASLELDEEGVPVNGQSEGVLITPSGWRVPVLGRTDAGWRVWTPCGREAEVADGTFVDRVDVVLDPGHGGSEPGATGANGLLEKDLNLTVARMAAERLQALGYSVLLTRADDVRVPIVTRAELALAVDPVAFISVHHNAGTDAASEDPGTEIFHQIESAESRRLAGILYEETYSALAPFGVSWVSMSDAGALVRPNREGGDFYGVLRRTAGIPSVISEPAYLSNPVEADLLARADVQEGLADVLARSFDRFVTTSDPGSGFTLDPIFRGYGSFGTGTTRDCDDPTLG